MEFFTKANIPTSDFKINYKSCLVFIGSCFADNISRQWSDRKDLWPIVANCAERPFSQGDVFFDGEKWCCWKAHSFISGDQSQETFIEKLNLAASTLRKTIVALRTINPNIHIVFTVSPLRHLNDGAHGNNLSKSTLLLAIEKIQQEFGNVTYFPSYEIVMDELRDYRFYADDMVHLSTTAEDYIFERMQGIFCDEKTLSHIKYVEKFMKTVHHRILDSHSIRTQDLIQQQLAKAENLEHLIEGLDLSEEKNYYTAFSD